LKAFSNGSENEDFRACKRFFELFTKSGTWVLFLQDKILEFVNRAGSLFRNVLALALILVFVVILKLIILNNLYKEIFCCNQYAMNKS
jgi:hypothetical protein